MALQPMFRNRMRPGAAPVQQRRLGGDALGNGLSLLGRTLSQAADNRAATDDQIAASKQRMQDAEDRRVQQKQALEDARALSAVQVRVAERVRELEAQPDEDAASHEESVREALNEAWRELSPTLSSDAESFDRIQTQFASYAAQTEVQAGAFAARQRSIEAADDYTQLAENHGRLAYTDPTPENVETLLANGAELIAGMPFGEHQRQQMTEAHQREVITNAALGMLDGGAYDALDQLLGNETFAAALGGGEEISRWRGRVRTGRDVQRREAEVVRAESLRSVRDALDLAKLQMERGDFRGSVADVQALLTEAAAAGMSAADRQEYAYLLDDALRSQSAQGLATPALQAEQERLEARLDSGELTSADRATLDAVKAELSYRDREAGQELSDLIEQGPQGVLQATAHVAATESIERRWAAARESGRPEIAVYAVLPERMRAVAVEGAGLRRERPDAFMPEANRASGAQGGRAGVEAVFNAAVGTSLIDQLGTSYSEHVDAALDLMAGQARGWDQEAFRRATRMVFGGTQRADGTWQGGYGNLRTGVTVELPDRWSDEEFRRGWNRLTFEGATYANGDPASAADVRRHFTPVYAGQSQQRGNGLTVSTYYLVGPNGGRLQVGGRDLELRVSSNPAYGMELLASPTMRNAQVSVPVGRRN